MARVAKRRPPRPDATKALLHGNCVVSQPGHPRYPSAVGTRDSHDRPSASFESSRYGVGFLGGSPARSAGFLRSVPLRCCRLRLEACARTRSRARSRANAASASRSSAMAIVGQQRWDLILDQHEARALGGREFLRPRRGVRETREELAAPRDPLDAHAESPLRLACHGVRVHLGERLARDHHVAAWRRSAPGVRRCVQQPRPARLPVRPDAADPSLSFAPWGAGS